MVLHLLYGVQGQCTYATLAPLIPANMTANLTSGQVRKSLNRVACFTDNEKIHLNAKQYKQSYKENLE